MNKQNVICINCGKVQIRTDLNIQIDKNYVFLKAKYHCPNCATFTSHIVTKNVKVLRKKLVTSCKTKQDEKILNLISR